MSVDVIKKIDYSCDKSLGNTSSVDLFMHGSHSHSIWGETVSVPSNSDFQSLLNSIKSLENRLGNIEKSLRECSSKIQAQDRIIAGISEKEKKFFDDICKKLKDSLSEGSPFFIQISSKIQNHIQTIQQSEKAIRESATSVENNKKTVENTANSSLQIIKKEILGLQELCERLKKNSLDFFSQSHSQLEYIASNSQTKINMIKDKTRELEDLCARIEAASEPFRNDISFFKRLKWLFTGRI